MAISSPLHQQPTPTLMFSLLSSILLTILNYTLLYPMPLNVPIAFQRVTRLLKSCLPVALLPLFTSCHIASFTNLHRAPTLNILALLPLHHHLCPIPLTLHRPLQPLSHQNLPNLPQHQLLLRRLPFVLWTNLARPNLRLLLLRLKRCGRVSDSRTLNA